MYNKNRKLARDSLTEKIFSMAVAEKVLEQTNRPQQTNVTKIEEMEDEIPFVELCSFALYKMYEEWAENGFNVPIELRDFKGKISKFVNKGQLVRTFF